MSNEPRSDLIESAYHEAGHAVVGSRLGLRVEFSTLQASDGRSGQTIFRHPKEEPRGPEARVWADRESVANYAGPVAEATFRKISPWEFRLTADPKDTDYSRVDLLVSEMQEKGFLSPDEDPDEYKQGLWAEAMRAVRNEWATIERLAGILTKEVTLSGSAVEKIVEDQG